MSQGIVVSARRYYKLLPTDPPTSFQPAAKVGLGSQYGSIETPESMFEKSAHLDEAKKESC